MSVLYPRYASENKLWFGFHFNMLNGFEKLNDPTINTKNIHYVLQ